MRGTVQSSGGSDGSFTDGALLLLRSSVAAAATKDMKKPLKTAGKAFQTAHDSSGWDRKARWQRAFNLARGKMGMQGMDESVDKWGAALREPDGADRRSASAQPTRRGSVSGGGPLAGCPPGTIAELRTPVALKEHLKRGKGARGSGLQLVALDGGGLEVPLSDQDAAAVVAQFDQRRQMLGAPASPSRPALTPADRALKAWTNSATAAAVGSSSSSAGPAPAPLITNAGTSSSGGAGGNYSCAGGNYSVASSMGGSSSSNASSSSIGVGGGGGGACGGSGAPALSSPAAATVGVEPSASVGAAAARALAGAVGSGVSLSGGVGGLGGSKLQRRLSESGSIGGGGCGGGGGDGSFPVLRRNGTALAPDSIIARQSQNLQRWESGSLHRPSQEPPAPAHSGDRQPAASGEAATPTRGSLSRQSSAAPPPAAAAAAAALTGHGEHVGGGWIPVGPLSESSCCGGGGGPLRPTPRPSSAGRRATHSPTWLPSGASAAAMAAATESPPPLQAGVEPGSPAAGPFASSQLAAAAAAAGAVQAQVQRQPSLALPTLQLQLTSADLSCSPPRAPAARVLPSTGQPTAAVAAAAAAGGGSGSGGGEPETWRLVAPSVDGASAAPASPGLQLAATSPVGAAGSPLLPTPPSASLDAAPGLVAGARRPRPRASYAGDGAIAVAGIAGAGCGGCGPGTASQPLPLTQQAGWIPADASPGPEGGAAATMAAAVAPPPPPPSRLVMHTSPASPSSLSPSRPGGVPSAYRRNSTSTPGFTPLTGPPPPPPPPASATSPPLARRPHAPAAPPTPTSPSTASPLPPGGAYRRASAMQVLQSNAAAARAAVGSSSSPPPGGAAAATLRQTAFKTAAGGGGGGAARSRLTDDGCTPDRIGGVTAKASAAAAAAAAAARTPVSDAVLGCLRVVATEAAEELSREAEVAAATRQALALLSRTRTSDTGGKPRHVSLPGDPWRKWG